MQIDLCLFFYQIHRQGEKYGKTEKKKGERDKKGANSRLLLQKARVLIQWLLHRMSVQRPRCHTPG